MVVLHGTTKGTLVQRLVLEKNEDRDDTHGL